MYSVQNRSKANELCICIACAFFNISAFPPTQLLITQHKSSTICLEAIRGILALMSSFFRISLCWTLTWANMFGPFTVFLCDKHIERTHTFQLISRSSEMCLDTGHMWRVAWEPGFGFTITQLLSAEVSWSAKRANTQRSVEPNQETPVEASCAATTPRLTQWHSKANWCRKPL